MCALLIMRSNIGYSKHYISPTQIPLSCQFGLRFRSGIVLTLLLQDLFTVFENEHIILNPHFARGVFGEFSLYQQTTLSIFKWFYLISIGVRFFESFLIESKLKRCYLSCFQRPSDEMVFLFANPTGELKKIPSVEKIQHIFRRKLRKKSIESYTQSTTLYIHR